MARSALLSADQPSLSEQVTTLDHLSTKTMAFTPGDGLAQGGWQLRARVDAPARKHRPVVSITTRRLDGTATTERLDLNDRGIGRARVPFDSDVIQSVELTLTNAGHRFDCREGTQLSCRGASKSNNRTFGYAVRLTQ